MTARMTTSVWERLRGHGGQVEAFQRILERGRLSQGYLFVGPAGIGKRTFAEILAQCLLCQTFDGTHLEACGECAGCKPFLAGTHPDFHPVGCPEGKRELPIELFVGSKERRGKEGLCHALSLRPLPGGRKIALIDDADLMNDASANSILKTLEEPPERAILILISSTADALLPTIRSRCQVIRFFPLAQSEIAALLLQHGDVTDPQEAESIAALSGGSLAAARDLLNPALRELRQLIFTRLAEPRWNGLAIATAVWKLIDEQANDTPAQREFAQNVFQFCGEFFRAVLLQLAGSDRAGHLKEAVSFVQRITSPTDRDLERVGQMLELVMEAARQIDQNVAVSLCLENLFAELARKNSPPAVHSSR